ncbi:hypothetical protein [Ammonifex thiophilus]|uniref:hypothetical protein n=1 Tax=Ammonifex thiophilus TaxID=444093 RepID=UPI00196B016F|nr:hypothetical protein [Ammonifex thiophilus]
MFKKSKVLAVVVLAGLLLALNTGVALAAENPIGDLLNSVGQLVGEHSIVSGSGVYATLPNGDAVGATATYSNKQTGLNGLLGGLLGGSYATSAELKGPNNLSAYAYTSGDYGLASSVRGLAAGLSGLLSGVLGR